MVQTEFLKIGKFCPRATKVASKTQNCGKNRANWEKRFFIQVSLTTKLIELVEISHAPANFLYFVNQCYYCGIFLKKLLHFVGNNVWTISGYKFIFFE